jgi:hypothetical protein
VDPRGHYDARTGASEDEHARRRPCDAIELVHVLMENFNQQLQEENSNLMVFEKIQCRLQQVIPFCESGQWYQGVAMGLSTPMTTHSQLHEFVEIVAPPGSSTMYKTALGGIFVATELHLSTNSSPDYQETWKFLQLRLDEFEQGNFGNVFDSNIPMAATTTVASSLFEDISSLLMLSSPASNNKSATGTKASAYVSKK